MGFDTTQRVTGGLTIIFAAFFVAHTVYRTPRDSRLKPQGVDKVDKPQWSADGKKLIRSLAASKEGKWVSMTIDTSQLSSFAKDYSLLMIVRVLDNHVEAITDTGIAKSSLFAITGEVRTIEVTLTDDFIARSDAVGQSHHQMSLQFYLALIPKRIRADQILTIADITALGGQQLQSNPNPEIISPTPFK